MKMRRTAGAFLLVLLCLTLSGCRTRTTGGVQENPDRRSETSAEMPESGTEPESPEEQEKNGDAGGETKENPEASRKEYDETRPAEILPGSERSVTGDGEGDGAFASGENSGETAAKLSETAEKTATQTVAAEEAEQKGTAEDAAKADSALTYYTVLLQERTGSLFECQRLYVYWETKEDYVTLYKTSTEHSLILDAGAYDVSARLLAENLRVDDGWIGRKNPGVIVKTVDRSVLGTGVSSTGAARKIYADLLGRDGWAAMDAVRNGRVVLLSEELTEAPYLQTAAALILAKTANPDLFADTEADRALEMLAEEATGSIPAGIWYYNGQGGI